MQAIMETLFDVIYLSTVITIGILMMKKSNRNAQYRLFGIMAVTLGLGDSFHLVPRALALCTTGLENYTVALGIGKFITSLTMTVFYILLYYVWRLRYKVEGKKGLTISVYALAILRIVLCLMPQNAWTNVEAPLSWGIYRNLPFAAMGILVIVLFYQSTKKAADKPFRYMWLTIVLSFAFYIPVVLFADTIPVIGVLMIPKTCAYVWSVLIGYNEMKNLINIAEIAEIPQHRKKEKQHMFQVKKRVLLAIAGTVWLIAGFNVARLGVIAYVESKAIGLWNGSLSAIVFCLFGVMFYKMAVKHIKRIMSYQEKKKPFWYFFDVKSYCIMIFMMSFGIWLRYSGLLPISFIAVFYTGLGFALALAGVIFWWKYGKVSSK